MKTKISVTALLAASAAVFTTSLASAHVSVAGPAYANTTWEATFGVGHGCDGADTYSVKVMIPAGVTAVRPVDGTLGKAVTEKDTAGNVVSITWTKAVADVLPGDNNYYKLPVRMRLPNTPFATLLFPTYQVCRDQQGNISSTDWVGTGNEPANPDGAPPPEPAPSIVLLPARVPGWNKFTVPSRVTNLSIFNDAEIVWADKAAYSVNPNYKELITTEPDTTALTEIAANTVIWVKY
jgi:uncharacterized protein YcnI